MSYQSITIADAISRVNQSLFLPAIQRPYVWKQEAIVSLFDSLLQGYPISSFLFWSVERDNRRNWSIFKFNERYRQGEPWNDKVEPDGRDVMFVLDGQQRLTSLLIGLRGSYTSRQRYGRRDKAASFRAHHLYLDLFQDPEAFDNDDEVTANRYGIKFSDVAPRSDHRHLWIKIGDILDLEHEERLASYMDQRFVAAGDRVTTDQLVVAEANLRRLHQRIWLDRPVSFHVETSQDIERVLAIFIRANDGGTKLSKADLLMSVVTTTWGDNYVREEVLGLVNRLNKGMGSEFSFDKDLVMRACLVLSELPTVYSVANFNAHNMDVMRENWPLVRRSLEGAVALAARFGLDSNMLTSTNTIIPIAYYLSRLDGHSLDGTSSFDVNNRERIRRWLFSSLINGVFGGNSDQTIAACRDTIREASRTSRDFPLRELARDLRTRRNRYIAFDEEGVKRLLGMNYGSKQTSLALSMLYDGRQFRARYHVDHVVSTASLSERALRERGVPGAVIERIRASANRLGNLQLLIDRENLNKSDGALAPWLEDRGHSFRERHMIPDDPSLWEPEAFLEFLEAREDIMKKALQRFLIIDEVA
ncbi:DUF262 domain-containing protein [Sphingomonas japonica]|uniref:GmrSD restriction endonucleases N-terminal domain-containing protein n=1 Tax=Sphingomonas japonica TaxID=511662 RepID=A0ABX0U0V1_9SPHN|nr:DUF262 domain-containing protein [Sphingomonas japonica]NIJ24209.1 hypothetical protein [Sphingomonas japonica]